MAEILNSSNINEINESMNFDLEIFKMKPRIKKEERKIKLNKLENLFKRFFHLKSSRRKMIKTGKILFKEERLKEWNEITRKESKEFHKMDRIAKIKLSKIIPMELSQKRFQHLLIPKETSSNSLKRIFQYLSFSVKFDLISESISSEPTNFRPLTFCPEFIFKDDRKKYQVNNLDWNVANLMIFQNLANLFYGISLDFCKPACCPIMTIGRE